LFSVFHPPHAPRVWGLGGGRRALQLGVAVGCGGNPDGNVTPTRFTGPKGGCGELWGGGGQGGVLSPEGAGLFSGFCFFWGPTRRPPKNPVVGGHLGWGPRPFLFTGFWIFRTPRRGGGPEKKKKNRGGGPLLPTPVPQKGFSQHRFFFPRFFSRGGKKKLGTTTSGWGWGVGGLGGGGKRGGVNRKPKGKGKTKRNFCFFFQPRDVLCSPRRKQAPPREARATTDPPNRARNNFCSPFFFLQKGGEGGRRGGEGGFGWLGGGERRGQNGPAKSSCSKWWLRGNFFVC